MKIGEVAASQPEIPPPPASTPIPFDPEPGIKAAPFDWSLWLLPIVLLMVMAGAGAIYYLPFNYDLLEPLAYWLFLATALLVLVAWRTFPMLASPKMNVERRTPGGKTSAWNPFASLTSLLLVVLLAVVAAAISVFVFALKKPGFYLADLQLEQPFVLLVASSVVLFLLVLVWLVRVRPLQSLMQLRFASGLVLIIPVFVYVAINYSLTPLLRIAPGYSGPYASWSDALKFARHEADRIDKDALLYDVDALNLDWNGPYSSQTDTFYISFRFIRPSGGGFEIEVIDTAPVRLGYVISDSDPFIVSYKYTREKFAGWFEQIKLGPRDIYRLTEKEANEFADDNGIDTTEFGPGVHISLTQADNWMRDFGVPAIWDMHYQTDTTLASYDLYADAANGNVLDRRSYLPESSDAPTSEPFVPGLSFP